MKKAGARVMGRWFVAAALLLFGLLVSGFSCPAHIRDHLPARAEARAASAQQSLQRRSAGAEIKVEQAKATPLLALLLALGPARRPVAPVPVVSVAASNESSLWLVPYLFRPPPAFLVC